MVFAELKAHKLVINGKKIEFFTPKIPFTGHIVSKGGVRMDPPKIESMCS